MLMVVEGDTGTGKPLVSVVIVNYNAGKILAECINAVLPQVSEILLVDNASTDSSLHLCSQLFPEEPKLNIIRNSANLGFAVACNIGGERTKSEFLIFLNPDCVVQPNVLMRMVDVMEKDSTVGMAGCLIRNPDGTEERAGRRRVPTPLRSLAEFSRLPRKWRERVGLGGVNEGGDATPSGPIEVEAISGAFMFVRRKALEQVGPLDAGYFLHCEDLDWCMRFRQAGWKILFVPDVEVLHYKGTCSKATPIRVLWYKHKGMVRFYRKFFFDQYPKVITGLVLGGIWVRFAVLASVALLRGLVPGARR